MSEKLDPIKILNKKEIFWLLGTTFIVLILNMLVFGIDGLKTDATIDLNIHDTYFIVPNILFILLLGVVVFFGVYFVRTLRRNFENLTANLIVMVSTILLILVLIKVDSILDAFLQLTTSWSIYPPLGAGEITPEIEPKENHMGVASNALFSIQILLLIFLTYSGFKTGRNYKQNG